MQQLALDCITELKATHDRYMRESENAVSGYFNSFKGLMDE